MAKKTAPEAKRFGLKINLSNRYIWFGLVPAAIYFIFFCFYSWPWIEHFNTWFFTDQKDGFQNIWNMWWVNFSVTHLHQLPWHTNYLHYPYGTTLIGQTLNPFNGFVAIGLLRVFNLIQAFNIMVIFSFVFGGVTTFWLCHFFSKRYIPSLIGGFIFTFSSYHFAQAMGHMQLTSLEWVPLFILLWWKLLTKPRYRTAIATAVVLLLVVLCDYYYFFYCCLTALIIGLYLWRRKEIRIVRGRWSRQPLALFGLLALVLVLPLPLKLLITNHQDPLLDAHQPLFYSTDAFSPFIDGGHWRFGWLTQFYGKHIFANVSESTVYLTWSVLILMIIGFIERKKIKSHINLWIIVGLTFGILSYGPRLLIYGNSIKFIVLPYVLLEAFVPGFKLSGLPVRMMVMAILASAVIASLVLARFNIGIRKNQLILLGFMAVLFLELWPAAPAPNVAMDYPAYVNKLAQLPPGAVLDNGAATNFQQLYNQTITHKPIVFGYISRVPTSVQKMDGQLTYKVNAGGYKVLCSEFKVRYFTTGVARPLPAKVPYIYDDGKTLIYDVKDSSNC